MPEPSRLVRRSFLVQGGEGGDSHNALRCQREATSAIPLPVVSDDNDVMEQAGKLVAGYGHGQQNPFSAGTSASEATSSSLHSDNVHTPTKPAPAGSVLRSDANGVLPGSGCVPPAVTPTATGKVRPPLTAYSLGARSYSFFRIVSAHMGCLLPSILNASLHTFRYMFNVSAAVAQNKVFFTFFLHPPPGFNFEVVPSLLL